MDICDNKNKINELLQGIFNEYNRMHETKIQSRCENDLEMRNMITTIRSLEISDTEKEKRNQELEGETLKLKRQIHEYEVMINDLQSKFEISEQEVQEENKFSMLRIQAKEITMKDREIDRLNKLVKNLREKGDGSTNLDKIDTVIKQVNLRDKSHKEEVIITELEVLVEEEVKEEEVKEEEVKEEEVEEEVKEEEESGFEIKAPLQKYLLGVPVEQLVSNSHEVLSEEEVKVEEEVEEEVKEEVKEEDKGDILLITYRKKSYYIYEKEEPQNVYEYLNEKSDDSSVGKVVGIRKLNNKGKNKITIHK
jgi:hypothetical protein